MNLLKFRVTDFRSVGDSGWVDVSDVTALIGENEAGKTNLLLPLWKMNPSAGGEISLLDDMPRSRYAEMRDNPNKHQFVHCVFELSTEEREIAAQFGADPDKTAMLEVRRNYGGRYGMKFLDAPEFLLANAYQIADEGQTDKEEVTKPNRGPSLFQTLASRLPKFVYYSNYGNLDAQIYLPHVVENLQRNDLGQKEAAKARTLKVLFDLVGLSPAEMLELARATGVTERINQHGQRINIATNKTDEQIEQDDAQLRERQALLQSASTALTREFRDWWKQGDYTFRLIADGNYFRIFVSDARRPEEVELENRSAGLQWFLSFFLVFSYESEDTHDNAIVLLDEPGHSLHPLAQRDLSEFFDSLAEMNQILFTTHSPFMIDPDRLDRVRKVYVDNDGGTIASSDLGQARGRDGRRETGATYAVHSALNLTVAESLLLGCRPIIVEGSSDQHYLTTIKNVLIGKRKIAPKAELVFPPAGGARTAKIIASILSGRDDSLPFVLLDSDQAGRQAAQALREELYAEAVDRVVLTDQAFDTMQDTEIEDLLPPGLLVQVLGRIERRADRDFEDVHQPSKPIIPQIKRWAEDEGFGLGKGWKVRLALGVKERLLANPNKYVDDELIERWKRLFAFFL